MSTESVDWALVGALKECRDAIKGIPVKQLLDSTELGILYDMGMNIAVGDRM